MPKPIMTIFHLSDVHIGEPGVEVADFLKILDGVENKAKDVTAPLLLITGDLTSEGLREEFEAFHEAVEGVDIPMVIVPGNHDERNYGTAHFEELFGPRFTRHETEDVALFAVDSSEPDNDAGHVGRGYYPQIRDFFGLAKNKIKILALHHHLLPVPHTGREHNVVEDAGDVLWTLQVSRCSLVLNGHRHVPWIWRLNDMVHYTTGTLLSRRIRGATTQVYTRIELTRNEATFNLVAIDGAERILGRSELIV
ncbi:metallophosphoesterase [Candidatus Thorarchaeota archaeon]|nr:MAG: metallophosphoesterase [Candidatus Thorarchaeota archaeon]